MRRIHIPPAAIRLFFMVGLIWASLVGPYSSILILQSMDATSSQIGLFSAICAGISMLGQPFWGLVSDKTGSPRKVLCFCLLCSSVLYGGAMFSDSLIIAAVLFCFDNLFRCCIVTLMDSHTISELNTIPGLRYGFVRVAGSLFFGSVSIINSKMINASGVKSIMPISLVLAAVAIVYVMFFAKGKWEKQKSEDVLQTKREKPDLKRDAIALFQNKLFIAYLIFVGIMAMGANPSYAYTYNYLTAVGGEASGVPIIRATCCLVLEAPIMIFGGFFFNRIDAKKLMFFGVLFNLAQMVGLIFANTPMQVTLVFLFGTVGFALCLYGKVQYLKEITPESVRSTSYTLAGACELGLGSIIGNSVGGQIVDIFGTRMLAVLECLSIAAALGVLALTILSPSLQKLYKQKLLENEMA